MSYDIYIGEARIHHYADEGYTQLGVRVDAMSHPEAPVFQNDSFTGNENHRHPGYIQWHDFTRATGMEDLWYDKENGLLSPHPGTHLLTQEHLDRVRTSLDNFKRKHPKATPKFAGYTKDFKEDDSATLEDSYLARLIWLEWWMSYALKNCLMPAIHNH